MPKTLYIIDGHWQIFRAYYAPSRDMTSPGGEPTRATYVFCSMLLKFLADKKPQYIAIALDGPAKELLRRQQYDQYKITRKPTPEDFHPQAKRIIQIIQSMGITVLQAKGYEADDIMATAAEKFASNDLNIILVSRDKDLDQLVTENVGLYDPMKNEVFNPASIERTKGYSPQQAIEVQTLAGDTIDNIPGVPGVGVKTAAKLIARYGTAEEVLKHADQQTPKLRENLLGAAETIALSRSLVTLDKHVPIDLDLEGMKFSGIDTESVGPIFAELGFKRLSAQLNITIDEPTVNAQAQTTAADFDYTCIDTPEALDKLAEQLKNVKRLAVDTETTGVNPMRAELVGISLAWQHGKAVYVPVKGPLGSRTLDSELVREKLTPILRDENIEKIGQNLKFDKIVLAQAQIELRGGVFDTMVAAHVLDSSRSSHKLDALALEFLNHRCMPLENLIGKGRKQTTIDTVPVETVTTYAAEDADVTLRLAGVLAEKLASENLTDLFAKLEMPLLGVLYRMERNGVGIDPAILKRMESDFTQQAEQLRQRIISLAGREFNVDSPKQLAEILFNELDMPVIKKVKTGPSTDSSVLEQLAVMHELPALVLDYRKLTKLLSTYLKGLAQCINPQTDRVHTSFNQVGTVTGRLSSRDPNLQNIPIRTPQGKKIRSAFIAAEGKVLLSADYSQVELRILAHLCEDPTLVAAFADDLDIHKIVAAEVFGVALQDVTDSQRSQAKTVNFGIIYGQTAFGLAITLRISRAEAGQFIKKYRNRFPKIDDFLAQCIEQAKSQGYVETIFGRRRKIADIDSSNAQARTAAERLAINSVVQGSAADMIKQAMINIDNSIIEDNRPSKMLLQIHDELLFEIPRDDVETEQEMIVQHMSEAIKLTVPLKVDVGVGDNWMDAK